MRVRSLFFLLYFLFIPLLEAVTPRSSQVDISLCSDISQSCAALSCKIGEPFIIHKIVYDADIPFDRDEMGQLMGFFPGMLVSSPDIERACLYLHRKNRFSRVCITIHFLTAPRILPTKKKSMHVVRAPREAVLTFHLTGNTIFRKLYLFGINTGKDTVRRWYVLEPGDFFDYEKHKHSCEAISRFFFCKDMLVQF